MSLTLAELSMNGWLFSTVYTGLRLGFYVYFLSKYTYIDYRYCMIRNYMLMFISLSTVDCAFYIY